MLLNLEKGSLVTVELGKQECVLQCRSGKLWVTVDGDPKDHVLEGAQESLISGPGKVVIGVLSGSCFGLHAESDLSVKVNEDYCESATVPTAERPRGWRIRSPWKHHQTRLPVLRVHSKIPSA